MEQNQKCSLLFSTFRWSTPRRAFMHFLRAFCVVISILLAGFGCTADIVNVKDAPVKTLSGKELTLDQTTKAIVLAGMGLKWQMEVSKPGHIVGTLDLRSHEAVVDIIYNTKIYSITYKSSKNLVLVDGNGNTKIHPNYNGWIENLDNAIRTQFVAIGT
jgi:hypothetical protein